MAFTTSLQTLLPLVAVINVAQGFFPPLGGGGFLQSPFAASPAFGPGVGYNNFPGQDPLQSQGPRRRRGPICTAKGENINGDYLAMTITPFDETGGLGPTSLFAGLLSPVRQVNKVSVSGTFVKGGAVPGGPIQGGPGPGLDGQYIAVLMEFGNTEGDCRGVGRPYAPQNNRLMNPALGPLGAFHGLTSPFMNRNPLFGGYGPQQQYVTLSTPINTRSVTSHFNGVMKANIKDMIGRAVAMCGNGACTPGPSNLCAVVRRDSMSVEEFAQAENQRRLLRAVAAQGNLQDGGPFGARPAVGIVGSDADDVFPQGSAIDVGGGGLIF